MGSAAHNNRIERANDGIRIGASSSNDDEVPAIWRGDTPRNTVNRARVIGNVITTQPIAPEVKTFGIFLGNIGSSSVSQNDVGAAIPLPQSDNQPRPHFGIYQFGYRGPRMIMSENTVRDLYNGYAVLPTLDGSQRGVWRLRDNGSSNCLREAVLATDVTWI